jgi:RNA polymerase sigma-70 factor (ECF subfamily)
MRGEDVQAMMAVVGDGAQSQRASPDLSSVFREESDNVYRTLLAFTGGRAAVAEDATAEAFARAIAQGESLRDPIAWIYRAAFRIAIDELRRESKRARQEWDGEVPGPVLVGLVEAMRLLSPNQRAAVVLRYVMDLDVNEVARRMGTAAPTVRVHIYRARTRLRELLGSEEVD